MEHTKAKATLANISGIISTAVNLYITFATKLLRSHNKDDASVTKASLSSTGCPSCNSQQWARLVGCCGWIWHWLEKIKCKTEQKTIILTYYSISNIPCSCIVNRTLRNACGIGVERLPSGNAQRHARER